MNDTRRAAWIAAFQENQRQIIEAHEAYQRALADGHAAFLKAMAESQAILARAIQGDEEVERWPEFLPKLDAPNPNPTQSSARPTQGPDEARPTSRYLTAGIVDAPRPQKPWSGLLAHARIGVVPDDFGVGLRLVDELQKRGWNATVSDGTQPVDCLIFLGALLNDERAVARGAGLRAAQTALNLGAEHIILVGDLGGRFGLDALEPFRAMHIGLLQLALDHGARFIDLDVGFRRPEDVAQDLLVELNTGGDQSPVGLPEDGRVALVEEPADISEHVLNTASQTCLLITDTPELVQRIREKWDGKLAVVGCHVENVEFSRAVVVSEPMELYVAVSEAQQRLGPLHTLLLAWRPAASDFVDQVTAASSVIHTAIAATAADPLRRIAAWNAADDDFASVVSWILMAEHQRRDDGADVVAIQSATFDPNAMLCQTGPQFWAVKGS